MVEEKKYPDPEKVGKDVVFWDVDKREWVKGFRRNIVGLPKIYKFKWSNCSTTNKAPDGEDQVIDIERARSVAVQVDSTDPSSDATSIDINVLASIDGVQFDTTPYAEMNFGDAEVKTMLVNPGPLKLKLRLDYNSGGSRADVEAKVKVIE